MSEDVSWPGNQMADLLAYNAASVVITGNSFRFFATRPAAEYGRWAAVVSELLDAEQQGGRVAAFRCYLRLVYTNPEFALLMASVGMRSPNRAWRLEDLPQISVTAGQATLPAAKPAPKLPENWSAWDLLAGRYDRAPAKRRAVREEEVYAALRQLGEATVPDLARHTGQDRNNVYRRLQKLLSRGLVQRSTTAAGITYRLPVEPLAPPFLEGAAVSPVNPDQPGPLLEGTAPTEPQEDTPSCSSSHPVNRGSDTPPDDEMDRIADDTPSCPSAHPTHRGSDSPPQPFKLAALIKPPAAPATPQPSRPSQAAPAPASKKKKRHNRRARR